MIIMIDNYDSFTYNLVQYLGELGAEVKVFRNDETTVNEIERLFPSHLVISPGPGNPLEGGISNEVIQQLGPKIPLLGVCLGHQCIAHVFGGKVLRAPRLMHGKFSPVYHDGKSIYQGIPNPFDAGRYHSLIVLEEALPFDLEVAAFTKEGEIMGIRHKKFPIEGVQFHPESILTPDGKLLLKNFLSVKTRS
ncbi:MAG: aminodeoxychorismate/anthranilate synthase component II [Firmicutes bacterium]|nr:aminodeoxychorismate/anthranilate synthase component II [Bacillota bacterium]